MLKVEVSGKTYLNEAIEKHRNHSLRGVIVEIKSHLQVDLKLNQNKSLGIEAHHKTLF